MNPPITVLDRFRRSTNLGLAVSLLILFNVIAPTFAWGMEAFRNRLEIVYRAWGMTGLGVSPSVKLGSAAAVAQAALPAPTANVYSLNTSPAWLPPSYADYLEIPGSSAAYGFVVHRMDNGFNTGGNLLGGYTPTGINFVSDGNVVSGGVYTYEAHFYRLGNGVNEPPTVSGPSSYFTIVANSGSNRAAWDKTAPLNKPCTSFAPIQGASYDPCAPREGSPADPINLADGSSSYDPEADLSVYNPVGPAPIFQRAFRTSQSLTGAGSPGLTEGWSHNYDITMTADPTLGAWSSVTLLYPYGAREDVTPNLTGGAANGTFTTPQGTPYIVTGSPSTTIGQWNWINIKFADETQWRFTPVSTSKYRLSTITNSLGQSLSFAWDSAGKLQTVKNQLNTTLMSCFYNAQGQLNEVRDNNGASVYYAYGTQASNGLPVLAIVSLVVATGTTNPPAGASYGYANIQSRSLLNSVTVPSPTGTGTSVSSMNYDTNGKCTSTVDANGYQKVFTYGAGSTLVETKDAANVVVTSYTQKFDSKRRDSGVIDAAGNATLVEYLDTANPTKPTKFTDRDGRVTSIGYDAFGNMASVTTPRNVTTTLTYDYSVSTLGRLSSSQTGTLPATSYTYYANGLVQTVTTAKPNNAVGTQTSTFTYDSLGNVLTVVSPGNNAGATKTTTFNYTTDGAYSQSAAVGQPLTVTDPTGKVSHMRYDARGRLTSAWDPLGNTTGFAYNLAGQVTTTTLPATNQTGTGNGTVVNSYLWVGGPATTTTVYNEAGTQVRQSTVSLGKEGELLGQAGSQEPATYTYDAAYQLKTLKDGNNNQTSYTYNTRGWVTSVALPGGDTWQYTVFDNEGHVKTRVDAKSVTTNYTYADPEGQLTAESYPATPALNTSYTYDSYGRLGSRTDGEGSYSYTYGNLSEVLTDTTTYTGLTAKTNTYTYYSDGSLNSVATPAGTFTYNYDLAGRPTSLLNPFSETTSWTWFDNSLLNKQTYQNGLKTTYAYNALGQQTSISNQNSASSVLSSFGTFTYDGAGNQLGVAATVPGLTTYSGTHSYGYNTKDELTSANSTRAGGFTHAYATDSAANLTTFKGATKTYNNKNQLTGTGFGYDLNGNATTWRGTTATWDAENRLKTYGTYSAGYRADDLRAWRQIGTTKTYFLYLGGELLCELNSTGAVTTTYTRGANGLISSRTGTTTQYYMFDDRGNTAERVNSAGTVLSHHVTDGFGVTTNSVAPGTDPYAGHGAQWGYYWESTPGLFYLHHRYYDPSVGRFLSRDPIGYEGGMNLYAYCGNAPVGALDPSGLQSVGQPGFAESLIPVWGSGRAAIDDFQNGRWGWGIFNTALAISDLIMVGTVVKTISKVGVKGIVKIGGSYSHGAVTRWMTKTGWETAGKQAHHCVIPQSGWGKWIPNFIKNQPWNLKLLTWPEHILAHGKTLRKLAQPDLPTSLNAFQALLLSTKATHRAAVGGRAAMAAERAVRRNGN